MCQSVLVGVVVGVVGTFPLTKPLLNSFIVRNPSMELPVSFTVSAPPGIVCSVAHGTIAPRGASSAGVGVWIGVCGCEWVDVDGCGWVWVGVSITV